MTLVKTFLALLLFLLLLSSPLALAGESPFVKLDQTGKELPDEAPAWIMVGDTPSFFTINHIFRQTNQDFTFSRRGKNTQG